MAETSFEIQIPTSLLQFGFSRSDVEARVAEWLVLSLYTEGRVSSGKAASLLDMSRVEFLVLLNARGISYLDFTPEEMAEEFEAAKRFTTEG